MDQATASIIASLIGALASVAVAWITTHARTGETKPASETIIGAPEKPPYQPFREGAKISSYAGSPRLRVIGLILVGFLYLLGFLFVCLGVFLLFYDHDFVGDISICVAPGLAFMSVAYWARRRLRLGPA